MGKGSHGHFQGTAGSSSSAHTLNDNLPKLTKKYPLSQAGYFGPRGKRGNYVRIMKLPEGGYYCPMIDARRMEVYTALYDNALKEVRPIKAEVIDEHFLEKELEEHPIYFFGDGADKCQEVIKHPNAHFIPNVRVMANDMMALAVKRFNQGKFDDTAYFVPFYLKEFVATLPKNQLQ